MLVTVRWEDDDEIHITDKELDELLDKMASAVKLLRPSSILPPPRPTIDVRGALVDELLGAGGRPPYTHEHWPSRDACRICDEGRRR